MRSILDTNSGRFLFLKWLGCSPNCAIVGHTQIGKSTFLYWLANEFTEILYALGFSNQPKWDYKNLCARSFEDFKNIVKNNNNSVIAIEEASFQLDSSEYWSIENKLFKVLMDTQGYKRNIYLLCFPTLKGIAKHHRLGVDFIFSVERKAKQLRQVLVKPNFVKKKYWLLSDKNYNQIWLNKFKLQYSKSFLRESMDYINWLKEYKSDIEEIVSDRYETHKRKGKPKLDDIKITSVIEPINVKNSII